MKQDKHILPILGLGLHFCVMNLYLAMMVVGRGAVSNGRTGIVAHFMLAPVCALLLVLFSRFFGVQSESCSAQAQARGGLPVFRLVRQPLPLLLLCSAALSVAWGFSLTTESLSFYGNLLPPALAMSLCLPVGLRLFFRTIPPERQGLLLGLAMASGELVWIILLPVFSAVFNASGADASLPGPVSSGMALHIFTIFCLFQAGTALCFAVTLALGESGTGKTAHHGQPGFTGQFALFSAGQRSTGRAAS